MNDNEKLINELYEINEYTAFFKKKKLKISKEIKEDIQSSLSFNPDSKKFEMNYKFRGKTLQYAYRVSKSRDMLSRTILCEIFKGPKLNKSELKNLIANLKNTDRRIKTLQFSLPIKSKLAKPLKELGAKVVGTHMLSSTQESLDYLNKENLKSSFEVSPLKKSELQKAVEMEYQAHRSSDTTRCKGMGRSHFKGFLSSMLKVRMNNDLEIFVARDGKEIIGSVVVSARKIKLGHLMTIAVDPSYQGQGVSKLLYREGLKYLKSKKVKVYSGVTTTTEVLGLAKKLKRESTTLLLNLKL